MAKKENNNKAFSNREAWMKAKKANRPKQVWVPHNEALSHALNYLLKNIPEHKPVSEKGHWEKV